jgi:ADP-heptose:LPS heptosyltransferase
MDINLIRPIDRYLGALICLGLLPLKYLYRYFNPLKEPLRREEIKKILLIKFFGMGSITLASPTMRKLKETYTHAEITILTLSANKEICELLPPIDRAVYLKIDNPLVFLADFIRIIFEIRKSDFDVIIDLEFLTNFSALVTLIAILFTKNKWAVGFNSPLKWRNNIHDINVSFDHSRHITKIFAKVVHSLGVEAFEPSLEAERAVLLEKSQGFIQRLLKSNNALKGCEYFVCVNINAGELCLHRSWPKEYFAKVVNELIKRSDLAVLLIGAEKDKPEVAEFKQVLTRSSRIVNLAGETSIRDLVGLFSAGNLLITNDGGPLHLAQIVGLPTISFFGPETPFLYGPLGKRHYVFYEDLYCSPCLNIFNSKMSHCRNNICLKAIKPERVLKVIEEDFLVNKKDEVSYITE